MKSILGRYRNLNLDKKIMTLILGTFIAVFVLCFSIFAFVFSYKEQKRAETMLMDTCHRIDTRIDNYISEIDMAATTVMYSVWVQDLLDQNMTSLQNEMKNYSKNASSFLSSFSSMHGDLKCFIVTPDGYYVKNNNSYYMSQNYDITQQEWYDELQKTGKYRIYGQNDMFIKNVTEYSMTTYYQVKNIYNFAPMGVFVINIDYSSFRELKELLGADEQILIKDEAGSIVYSNMDSKTAEKIDKGTSDGTINTQGDLLFYHGRVMDGNWELSVTKNNVTWIDRIINNLSVFLLLIPAIVLSMIISLLFSRYLTTPIVLCTEALGQIRNQNYNVVIQNKYKDEIGDMIDGFNDMSLNIKRLIDQNRIMYKSRQQAEFKILQQRINPHFLCNTLEIINGMILCGEDDKALELTGMLGTMYRYDLGENDIALVREELDYLKNYLAIVSYKYRDLQVEYHIDEPVLEYKILKFICQPLVENTLKHGFREMITNCKIEITLEIKENQIHICIIDNGSGIEPGLLNELKYKIEMLRNNQDMSISSYIGLLNTARRIFLNYGSTSVFEIESVPECGTRIEIYIPMEE